MNLGRESDSSCGLAAKYAQVPRVAARNQPSMRTANTVNIEPPLRTKLQPRGYMHRLTAESSSGNIS